MYLATCYDEETICQRLNHVHEAAVASLLQVHLSFHIDLEGSKFTGFIGAWPPCLGVLLTRNVQEHAKVTMQVLFLDEIELASGVAQHCLARLSVVHNVKMLLAEWLYCLFI
jgi:hypothetical protein